MASIKDWELVRPEPLGSGGQSEVFLVRRHERRASREEARETIQRYSGAHLNPQSAELIAKATIELAREDNPSELAALKKFIPRGHNSSADESARGRLRNEIEVLEKKHDGFLRLIDSNFDQAWIVTEFCANGTLERNLARFRGKALASLEALTPLIRTVADLHIDGIVHRDIKPQNIFVGSSNELLLGDFGIVFLPNLPERLSFTNESVGPRDFMPPWIFLGDMPGEIRPTFDVYMLGKVLWCMVSGKMKLHREDFREPQLDLTKLFPNDPHMYAINAILEKTVVTREKDCMPNALDLWLMVGKLAEMMKKGAQVLWPHVPRPCRICGEGEYRPEQYTEGQANPTASFPLNRIVTNSSTGQQIAQSASGIKANLYCCDRCGHVQLFKVAQI